MVFGLIGAGLQIAQTVKGAVDAGKAAKGGGGGGEEAGGAAAKKGGDPKAGEGKKVEGNPVDRFLDKLNNPNVKTLADIKGVRDKVIGQLEKQGLDGDKLTNAKRKLNQAVLKKLNLLPKQGEGDATIELTPKTKRMLDYLGMKPDEIKGGTKKAPTKAPVNNAKAPAGLAPGGKPG